MGEEFGGSTKSRIGPAAPMYYCPVPPAYCTGKSAGKETGTKCHNSVEEVRRCQKNYLEKQGYRRRGPREFESPEGSILILSKKTARMKPGKGSRYMSHPLKVLLW